MLKVVLDTNIILSSVSPFSPYRLIFDKLDEFDYELCVSTEILLEYEEKLSDIFSPRVAELTMNLMMVNPNIVYISPKFKMQMISPIWTITSLSTALLLPTPIIWLQMIEIITS